MISSRYHDAMRELTAEGVRLRCLHCYALLEDETYLCIVGATETDAVVELNRRAGVVPDHVAQMLRIDALWVPTVMTQRSS